MPCGCPTLLRGKAAWGIRREERKRERKGSPQYLDGLQMFIISLGCACCQVDRCCWKNLYYSEERLTFQEWERGREGARAFGEEMTLNRTANHPEHAGSLKGCVITLPKRTVLGEISFHHGFPCHEFKLVFKAKY